MQKNYDYVLKMVIVGSSSVGKSSILRRFSDDQFMDNYVSTIGIDFRFKSMYIDQHYVKLQIWDTAGQERFRGVTKSYYKGAHCVILVYDATNPDSFQDLVSYWIKQSRQFSSSERIFCFINKCDRGQSTEIDPEHLSFLKQNKIKCFKVSAKKGYKITESILEIAQQIMKQQPKHNQSIVHNLSSTESHRRQAKGCCSS